MFLQSVPLVFVLTGLVLYTVLGGADFGAEFWQLFAGRGERADRVREHAQRSMSASSRCCPRHRRTRWAVIARACPIAMRWTRSCWCCGRECSETR